MQPQIQFNCQLNVNCSVSSPGLKVYQVELNTSFDVYMSQNALLCLFVKGCLIPVYKEQYKISCE